MRRIIKGILHRTWKPYVQWYLKSPRNFRWGDISITVLPEVFHPGFFFSTAFLLKHLRGLRLYEKKIIEVGSGTGLISIFCFKNGAQVTACDISGAAVENTRSNALKNKSDFHIYQSDLFSSIPPMQFDLVVVNPPYYKKNPATLQDHAWFCGENLEYFTELFKQAVNYTHNSSEILMVLSDECDLKGIRAIAQQFGWNCSIRMEKLIRWEKNYILSFSKLV